MPTKELPSLNPEPIQPGQQPFRPDEYKISWRDSVAAIWHPKVLVMLFLGFSAGVPILLIFSSLSLWLREAGVERATVTFFSWAALGYSFKFIWAPLVDQLPLPVLRQLGRRRSWLLLSQLLIIAAIVGMSGVNPAYSEINPIHPEHALAIMAMFAVMLGFASATQDIVIDAYRIEIANERMQAILASAYIAGYRVGMIVAGAGALYLAAWLGSSAESYSYSAWRWTYLGMAAMMCIGIITTLAIDEPQTTVAANTWELGHRFRLLLVFGLTVAAFVFTFITLGAPLQHWAQQLEAGGTLKFVLAMARLLLSVAGAVVVAWVLVVFEVVPVAVAKRTWVEPIADFFQRYGAVTACLLLALIGLYRISDIVLGVISNVFYQDIGFTKTEIATAVKTFGIVVTILGGFLGGILANRFGVMRGLMWGAILSAATNLLFVVLAYAGDNLLWLYAVVAADNFAAGLASAAFIAFLSNLTQVSFTAVQYALFSSLMTLLPKVLAGYSGGMVDTLGYPQFFILTTLLGLPVLLLVWLATRYTKPGG